MRLARTLRGLPVLLLLAAVSTAASAQGPMIEVVGKGCGLGAGTPSLECTAPILGTKATLSASGLSGQVPAFLCVSEVPSASVLIAPGCSVYVDPDAFVVLDAGMTDAMGLYEHQQQLPSAPELAGLRLALQVVAVVPDVGVELTQGLVWTLGQ